MNYYRKRQSRDSRGCCWRHCWFSKPPRPRIHTAHRAGHRFAAGYSCYAPILLPLLLFFSTSTRFMGRKQNSNQSETQLVVWLLCSGGCVYLSPSSVSYHCFIIILFHSYRIKLFCKISRVCWYFSFALLITLGYWRECSSRSFFSLSCYFLFIKFWRLGATH